MIKSKIKIAGLILIPIFLSFSFYWIGFYKGTRRTFLFNSSTSVTRCINTIKYIDNELYGKAKSVQSSELEVNIATVTHIEHESDNLIKIFQKILTYSDLLSFDEQTYIDRAKKQYSTFVEDESAAGT